MGRTRKNPIEPTPTGPPVTTPTNPDPVRPQVKEMFGQTKEELEKSLPESTATIPGATPEKRTYKKRTQQQPTEVDPLMSDPVFREAVSGMVSFGGARTVKTVFRSAAAITAKPDIDLNPEESKLWDQYFYVVGKKSNFDPTRPWYLVLYAFILLTEQVVVRLWKLNVGSFANSIGKFFGVAQPEEETEKETEEEPGD